MYLEKYTGMDNNYAVSTVISSIFAIVIVLTIVSSILLWGIPYMEILKATASIESMGTL